MYNVDFIMRFENGEADQNGIVEEFQHMIDDGSVWRLQGMYGRVANTLISAGLCTQPSPNGMEGDK